MSWFDHMKTIILSIVAAPRRYLVRLRTDSAFRKLDDRLLADIGIPRHKISDYAHRVALKAVPISDLRTLKTDDSRVAIAVEQDTKFGRVYEQADINGQSPVRRLRASSGI